MNKQTIRKTIATLAVCGVGFISAPAMAGPDFFQQQMTQRIMQAKQKLQQAEAAKGAERQKLMDEHMKMLHETMGKCAVMKPKAGMSAQERDEWYSEHQKLMNQMMEQMMEEHRVMMEMGSMPMDMGDMHKH